MNFASQPCQNRAATPVFEIVKSGAPGRVASVCSSGTPGDASAQRSRRSTFQSAMEAIVRITQATLFCALVGAGACADLGPRSDGKEHRTPLPENDIWIAAICLQHGLTLLTLDRHFDRIEGLALATA